jgi:hypothetical protein
LSQLQQQPGTAVDVPRPNVVDAVAVDLSRKQGCMSPTNAPTVEQWDFHEITLNGPAGGNPFVDVQLSARFIFTDDTTLQPMTVRGFYDGDGTYRIRFMPTRRGTWRYETQSN